MQSDPDKDTTNSKQPKPSVSPFIGRLLGAVVLLALAWLMLGGRVSYAIDRCSKGTTRQCVTGIGVALGLVDVYDKNGQCTGVGCNF